jgi:hypothetical protein
MKPNLIEAGDIFHDPEGDGEGWPVKFCLMIQCTDAEQVEEAIRTGTVSFTVFGGEPKGGDR